MIIRICYFTKQGRLLADKLMETYPDLVVETRSKEMPLDAWTKESFAQRLPILFIGAAGIAVRAIAPFVKDKLADSAVLVMDEKGQFVIPLLSGHMGGANELAMHLAESLQATPVLTTATDVEGMFSVDVFARKNHLHVVNREGIRTVSSKVLRGEPVKVYIEEGIAVRDVNYPKGIEIVNSVTEAPDVVIRRADDVKVTDAELPEACLVLETREYVIGMGCKKGKSYADIMAFLEKQGIAELEKKLYALASIDIKNKERGLLGAAQYLRIPFMTYTAEELAALEGDFSASAFVEHTTGVSNVCERAAMCCAGEDAELMIRKTAADGMTFAAARRKPEIVTWET